MTGKTTDRGGGGPVADWAEHLPGVVEAVRPYLMHVQAVNPAKDAFAAGTGLVLDHYHALASAQIAGAKDEVTVRAWDGKKYAARVLAVDPVYLITVLRLDGRLSLDSPSETSVQPVRVGQPALLMGCPFGLDVVASAGVVSATDLTVYRQDNVPVDGLIATDAALHPGNLGGPLVSAGGGILGVSGLPWIAGFHLVIQREVAVRVANQIVEFGAATHPWLGFSGQPEVIEERMRDLFALPVDRGLVVSHVAEGGPGERAGVQVFDMVVRIEGEAVASVGTIRKRLSWRRPGEEVTLTVLRSGHLLDMPFPIEDIPRLKEPS